MLNNEQSKNESILNLFTTTYFLFYRFPYAEIGASLFNNSCFCLLLGGGYILLFCIWLYLKYCIPVLEVERATFQLGSRN